MIDLSFIGKEGIIVQYEDIVSMIGFNVARYFQSNNVIDKLDKMTLVELLSSYLDRKDEDSSIWLKKEFNIDFDISKFITSPMTMKPNMLYSYKIFETSKNEGIHNMIVYSDIESDLIDTFISTYENPDVKCVHGNLLELLKEHPNYTYITASPKNINLCKELETPLLLVVCDDYMYSSYIYDSDIGKVLKEKQNIILRYTSCVSAGIF